jgi:hypothetical protein
MKQASCQNNEVNGREDFLFFKRLILKQEVVPMRGRKQQGDFIQKNFKNTRNEMIVHWTTYIKWKKEIRIMKLTKKHFAQLSDKQQLSYLMFRALIKLENLNAHEVEVMYLDAVSQPQDLPDATLHDLILYDSNIDTDDDDEAFSEWLEETKDDDQDFLDH